MTLVSYLSKVQKVAESVKLKWYGKFPKLEPGEKWRLLLKLKKPHGLLNPGGFDYENNLHINKITATGYVVCSKNNRLLDHTTGKFIITRIRYSIVENIGKIVLDKNAAAILMALSVGFNGNISTQQWQLFQDTGTSHLVAISGLHIGLIYALIYLLSKYILRRIFLFIYLIPINFVAAIFGLIGALGYSALAGFGLPTQRALSMLIMSALLLLHKRKHLLWLIYLWTMAAILLANPLAAAMAGFWLSFGAVGLLIYCLSGRLKAKGLLWKYCYPQLIIMLGLSPLALYFFCQFSISSLLANIVAIPYVGLLVLPCDLLGCLFLYIYKPLGSIVIIVSSNMVAFLLTFLTWIAKLKWLIIVHTIANPLLLIPAIVGVVILLAPKKLPARYLGICYLLPLLYYKSTAPTFNSAKLTLLDVGQGLAAVLQTQHHVLVYDTGPKFDSDFDAGESIVVPYLHYRGINKVDTLVVSHGDNDHIGGAGSLLKSFAVNKILTSVPNRFAGFPVDLCYAGQSWNWDGVTFRILSPVPKYQLTGNNASCVLQVKVGRHVVLFTGDIESETEKILLKKYSKDKLKADILIVPHHGSVSSSSLNFIDAVQPKYALFATGYLNRFHFPSNKVLNRYAKIHTINLNTAITGAITFDIFSQRKINFPILSRKEHNYSL